MSERRKPTNRPKGTLNPSSEEARIRREQKREEAQRERERKQREREAKRAAKKSRW